ncbi:vacuolar ATPase assembly integral membrane protein vma21 [Orbilia oligospora]|uniref:Vacuolar ATPase assembly integral membrane protein vma21 n=1 Tax=Orbilia oligospora TaxID=2813651 RepID=A0A7C8JBR1_ORBOL|nr:vacuolar ATPase assembly integral membrane protein vma21 [Orbilia oligospora]KAF3093015.1 vacuolar ATPase assembly integral membrane protein vma21 [Orbilia oligospora]KAF3109121.1 vacuolar ATPase assembly integral membrane protein vma21 [Orbilia oligospora]KAF3122869.1 vacuolar ATPase assembly integral membrane protein vma21 [Orbilia oligospora]KAF3127093.1 vacuolar ATPase assembly integral membrane protein vma21 [Orbilia oligospora]
MATRRNVKSPSDEKSDNVSSPPPVLPKAMQAERMKNNPGPSIPREVLLKLFGFTVAMLFGPIGCYYLTTNYISPGSTVLGASIAAVVANVVLVLFILVAMKEDDGEETKKTK